MGKGSAPKMKLNIPKIKKKKQATELQKLENEAANTSGVSPVANAPPAYNETPPIGFSPVAPPGSYPMASPGSYPMASPGSYPASPPVPQQQPYSQMQQNAPMTQAPVTNIVMNQTAPPPPQIIMQQAQAPSVNVNVGTGSGYLPAGVCTVCRKGKISDSASCMTWVCCLLLLPFGIIPGLLVFCCCCRHPKCSHCGYTI